MPINDIAQYLADASGNWKDNVALTDTAGRSITYGQYFDEAVKIAGSLRTCSPGLQTACIVSRKSIAGLCIIQSILAAKATYVPLNPNSSFKSNYDVFCNYGFDVMVIEEHLADKHIIADKRIETIRVWGVTFIVIGKPVQDKSAAPPGSLAYVLFTSGSTGTPKGIAMTHQSTIYFIDWCSSIFKPTEQNVFSSIAHWCFDLSVLDIFLPIKHGSRLLVLDEPTLQNPQLLCKALQDHMVTNIYATPTLLKSLVNYGKPEMYSHNSITKVLFAGERYPIKSLAQLRALWPDAAFYNLYGPTETNVCLYYQLPDTIEHERSLPYPIGQPCFGTGARITGGAREGLLQVSGPGLMAGYYNDETKTQSAMTVENGVRWYNTGDLVRLDDTGNYHFIGRKDRQVKRRGYRIELDEIEHVLGNCNQVVSCAVTSVSVNGETNINAYAVFKNTEATVQQLREYLLQRLENYKLPDKFYVLADLPITVTGKVDYALLKEI